MLALVGAARKIKLSSVVDQSLDAEITPLSSMEVRQLYDAYKGTHGDYPVEDAEATADQISGVQQLVRQDFNPYVDFGVFGPFALRILRKLTFVAYTVGLCGEYIKRAPWATRLRDMVEELEGFQDCVLAHRCGIRRTA